MDLYHVWCDLKPGVGDMEFSEKLTGYLVHLKTQGLIEAWRLARRKLGLGPSALGEFHLMIEVRNLAQLDDAFQRVASRREPTEGFHFGANSLVQNATFALYREFPDPVRHHGEERF
jgi:Family of unknown function (DUF6614)